MLALLYQAKKEPVANRFFF